MSRRWIRTLTCALLGLAGPGVFGQTPSAQQTPPVPAPASQEAPKPLSVKRERFAIGFRVRSFPLRAFSVMDNHRTMTTLGSKPAQDWRFNTTSRSPWVGGGPAGEIRLGERMTLTAEALFSRLRYDKVIDSYSGSDDPATGHDERSHTNLTETTKARLWDFPLLLHYRGLRSSGALSQLYVAGGVTARTVSNIRTSNKFTKADGSASADYLATQPSRRNLLGGVVGLGFRFTDDFNIKVTPEIRYTRWSGASFSMDTTRSPKNQLEFGIGFTR